jgi:hypothetical protein
LKKTLLALAGAVVLLVLVLGVKTCADRRMHREVFVFDTAQVARVERLEIAHGGRTAVLAKRDGRWVTSDGFPVDSLRMGRVLAALLRTRATEKVSESGDPARLAEFGLSEGEAKRLRWKLASGEAYTLLLGKTSGADFSSTFWKWEGAREVYRTPGAFTHEASVSEADWKSRAVLPSFAADEVASVAVDWADADGKTVRYRIDRAADSSAVLSEPFKAPMPRESADEVFGQIPGFKVDAFVEPWEDRPSMKLDTPLFRIEIRLKDKTVHRLAAGDTVRQDHQLYRYAFLPGTKHPVKILEERFARFRKTGDQLLNPPMTLPVAPEGLVETIDPSTFEDPRRAP